MSGLDMSGPGHEQVTVAHRDSHAAISLDLVLDRQAREDPVVQLSVELLEGTVEAVVPRKRG